MKMNRILSGVINDAGIVSKTVLSGYSDMMSFVDASAQLLGDMGMPLAGVIDIM